MKFPRSLAIDDARHCEYAHIVARTYRDGIAALTQLGPWERLYLDHDLGSVESQCSETGAELTGYHVLCFLEEHPEYLPKEVILLTSNAAGRLRMQQVLKKLYPDDGI